MTPDVAATLSPGRLLGSRTPTATDFRIAVVDDDPKMRTRLALQAGDVGRSAAFATLTDLESKLPGHPVLVVLGPTFASPVELQAATRFLRSRPGLEAVLALRSLSAEVLQQALRAGVRDAVLVDDPEQVREALERSMESLQAASPRLPAAIAADEPDATGRITTVFSTKGGAGKSFLATNLAVALARRERTVALVDVDLQFGDVAVMLKLSPQRTVLDAVQQPDRLDEAGLRSALVRHEPSGLLVMPAPTEPAFADAVGITDLGRVLDGLAAFCDHVVIDTPAHFNDVVLGVLERSDDIVLVAGMDVPHIKNTKIGLQTLRLLNVPAAKVRLALNRANSKVKLDISEVERILQMRAEWLVPSEVAVPQSINRGTPIVLDNPRSGVAKAIERIADGIPAPTRTAVGR